MHSIEARSKQTFLRNEFNAFGKWEMPFIKKNKLDLENVKLICHSDIKTNDNDENKSKGVHFFIDDYRIEGLYYNFDKHLSRLSQYKFLLTPDYSLYNDLPKPLKIFNVFKNRWCGAYWQSKGLIVIPTISWGNAMTYDYCFDGVEKGSVVAVSTLGCRKSKLEFMRGYNTMLEKIEPEAIICFSKPFEEMRGNIICVDYNESRKVVRYGR